MRRAILDLVVELPAVLGALPARGQIALEVLRVAQADVPDEAASGSSSTLRRRPSARATSIDVGGRL